MSAPLTNRQKFILADLARQAWSRQSAGFRREIDEEHFRHLAVTEAVGKAGLRSCSQADYAAVKTHFLKLLGREDEALNADLRGQTNTLRVAKFKLREACRRAGVDLNYAAAICRSKFKTDLEDATEKQIWVIKYDLDRAVKRKKSTVHSPQSRNPTRFDL